MTDAEIDALTAQVDGLIAKIDREVGKARHRRVTVGHFDDGDPDADYGDGDSNPSLDASEADDEENPDNDLDEDEDPDEEDGISKLGGNPKYQHEETAGYQQGNDRFDRPGPLSSSTHPSAGLATSAAVQPPGRHKFDDRVDHIKNRDSVTKQVALQRARIEFPGDYQNYQMFHAGTSTQEQAGRRDGYGSNLGKSAPATAQSLIAAEIRKGFSYELAAQRVAQQHGFRAFDRQSSIAKRATDIADTFKSAAVENWYDDASLSRTEALRKTRLANPRLFKAYQRT
jgi:hypothetical protein